MNTKRALLRIAALVFAALVLTAMPGGGFAPESLARDGERPTPAAPAKKVPVAKKEPEKKAVPAKSERRVRTNSERKTKTAVNTPRRPREPSINGLPGDSGESRFFVDQVIVRFRLSAPQASMDEVVRRLNLRHEAGRTFALAGVTVHLYTIVGGAPVRQVIAALQADQTVVTAQPNYVYTLQQTTAATANPAQYALARLKIPEVHAMTRGAGVTVAVIDSGIDFTHPELAAANHTDLSVTGEEAPLPHKHGTTIAGIIASRGKLTGIAPDAPLIGIRAFDTTSSGNASSSSWWVAAALDAAHKNGAGVVNMSFAGPHDPLIENSIRGAAKRGIVAVAAAGNDGPDAAPLYPAAYGDVIAVTAIDKADALFGGANQGDYVALSAPGVDILAAAPGGGYDISTGTSMAAAHVSGIIALIMSRKPGLTRAELLDILDTTATDLGAPGADPEFGFGLPNALTAVKSLGI